MFGDNVLGAIVAVGQDLLHEAIASWLGGNKLLWKTYGICVTAVDRSKKRLQSFSSVQFDARKHRQTFL